MVIPSRLPEYIVAAMVIILAPGPSVLFVIARAIAWGRKTAVFTVAGNVTGAFALSTLVAIGLGPVLQRSDLAYAAIQWGGGLYLMYLGVDAIRHRRVHAEHVRRRGDRCQERRVSGLDGEHLLRRCREPRRHLRPVRRGEVQAARRRRHAPENG